MYLITFKNGKELLLPQVSTEGLTQITKLINTNEGNNFLSLTIEGEGLICGFIPNEIVSIVKVKEKVE